MKSKQLVLIAIALLCGLVSAIGIIQAMGSGGEVAAEIPHGPVVVASAHLDHKAELTDENIKLESWPLNLIPEGAATDLTEVSGKFITTRLRSGQAVVIEDVANRNDILGLAIPPGQKVINIKVPPEDLLGGLLTPGDRVDIIGVFNTRQRSGEQKSETKTFLKGIRIFNIGASTSAQVSRNKKGGTVSSIVGVLVTETQSEKIVWARRNGEIRLAMIGDQVESEEDPEFNMDNEEKGPKPMIAESEPSMEMGFDKPKKPKFDMSKLRKVKIYSGDQATTTWFDEAGNEVKMSGEGMTSEVGIIGMPSGASERPQVDYEESDDSVEIDNGIEEDQYRGE